MEEKVIEIPLILENVLRYCLKDARERMEKGEEIVPFTALAVGETLFMEEHASDTVEGAFASAKKTVGNARGALAYGFCYDGYVDTDMGRSDALIAEGGMPGEPYGHVIGITYSTKDGEGFKFRSEPIYIGPSLNYMGHIVPEEQAAADEDAADSSEAAGEATGEESEE